MGHFLLAGFVATTLVLGVQQLSTSAGASEPPVVRPASERHVPDARGAVDRPLAPVEILSVLRQAGWPESRLGEALRVSGCESGWSPTAVGDLGEVGLFQIHPVHAWRFPAGGRHAAMDPVENAAVALEIWREEGWLPWSCAYRAAPRH